MSTLKLMLHFFFPPYAINKIQFKNIILTLTN